MRNYLCREFESFLHMNRLFDLICANLEGRRFIAKNQNFDLSKPVNPLSSAAANGVGGKFNLRQRLRAGAAAVAS
jgi:hypothetical protein